MPVRGEEMDRESAAPINIRPLNAIFDHTPPRSPTKAPASPASASSVPLASPLPPQLPTPPSPSSTVVERGVLSPRYRDSHSAAGRPSAENIRIYADSGVYVGALLADVEEEINRMAEG